MVIALITLLLAAAGFVVGGYTMMTLWGWFVVPLGVPAIGFWWALGLQSTVWAFSSKQFKVDDDSHKTLPKKWLPLAKIVTVALAYAAALGFGWLWHYLMQ